MLRSRVAPTRGAFKLAYMLHRRCSVVAGVPLVAQYRTYHEAASQQSITLDDYKRGYAIAANGGLTALKHPRWMVVPWSLTPGEGSASSPPASASWPFGSGEDDYLPRDSHAKLLESVQTSLRQPGEHHGNICVLGDGGLLRACAMNAVYAAVVPALGTVGQPFSCDVLITITKNDVAVLTRHMAFHCPTERFSKEMLDPETWLDTSLIERVPVAAVEGGATPAAASTTTPRLKALVLHDTGKGRVGLPSLQYDPEIVAKLRMLFDVTTVLAVKNARCTEAIVLAHDADPKVQLKAEFRVPMWTCEEIKGISNKSLARRAAATRALVEASDILPNQAILENFVHHNPLHHFEFMKFDDAVDHVLRLESIPSAGERAFLLTGFDPRIRANEALADLAAVFLDRGSAAWAPPEREKGFLYFFASLEHLGFTSWRGPARKAAARVLDDVRRGLDTRSIAKAIIIENLLAFDVLQEEWADALRSKWLQLRGWAGMFRRMELVPAESPPNAAVRLMEYAAVESILMRSSIEALAEEIGGWRGENAPISSWLTRDTIVKGSAGGTEALAESEHPSALSTPVQDVRDKDHRNRMEAEYEECFLRALATAPAAKQQQPTSPTPKLQVWTCMDDRCESIRRHIEAADPNGTTETLGVAGFFYLAVRYRPIDGNEPSVLAPVGRQAQCDLVEQPCKEHEGEMNAWKRRRRLFALGEQLFERASFSPIASVVLSGVLFPFTLAHLIMFTVAPTEFRRLYDRFNAAVFPPARPVFTMPYPPRTAAMLLAQAFKDTGASARFPPLVIILGHGSTSVNNPFFAAYNCGACSGRHGSPNARLFCRLANDATVRHYLALEHGITIPAGTLFVGGLHNTTSDVITFFDEDLIPASHRQCFADAVQLIRKAAAANARERCDRFLLAEPKTDAEALEHVRTRTEDFAEVRPELNHAANAAVIVGRRSLTQGVFLDRRSFLPSYDPLTDDAQGTQLERVLGPALAVCSGINLEYLFSTIHTESRGAGTKVPLNVVGNIGVLQGAAGDLRPGLPTQMTEMHTPIRALFIVDAPTARVEAVLLRRAELKRLVRNEWVRMLVRDPVSGVYYRATSEEGQYEPVTLPAATGPTTVSFAPHRSHAAARTQYEQQWFLLGLTGMMAACLGPLALLDMNAHTHAPTTVVVASIASMSVLSFSRRYLHGEHMFGRFTVLSVALLLGFNTVAVTTTTEVLLAAWGLFGFASTFLIGFYNDRPTARNNATFAFASYRLGDVALLVAAAMGPHHFSAAGMGHCASPEIAAAAVIVAAMLKSSQYPLARLFARSMEGPTPSSALGYAGLSAHIGVVLLASTSDLWMPFPWARGAIAAVGTVTAIHSSLKAKTRPDRKGALAFATSATLGVIFVILAAGQIDLALLLSLGHASFRITQILRSPNSIQEAKARNAALGTVATHVLHPSRRMFDFVWALRRFDTDFELQGILKKARIREQFKLSRRQQWAATAVIVVLAGAPLTPLSFWAEEAMIELLQSHPLLAMALLLAHWAASVLLMSLLFERVLHGRRFGRKEAIIA